VQGVGSKAALKILGTIQISMLSRAILTGDINAVKATPGIGPKIAQRIISELKDKTPALMALSTDSDTDTDIYADNVSLQGTLEAESFNESEVIESNDGLERSSSRTQSESLSALTNLGYSYHDAALAITNVLVDHDDHIPVSELIKLALRKLSPKE
jgi:Holliday junction DNA helicase RuvA